MPRIRLFFPLILMIGSISVLAQVSTTRTATTNRAPSADRNVSGQRRQGLHQTSPGGGAPSFDSQRGQSRKPRRYSAFPPSVDRWSHKENILRPSMWAQCF